ncbi:MAG: hypothetical protein WBW93_17810 [Steroidobacteraceae bacterium]
MSKLDEILRSRGVLPAKAANPANPVASVPFQAKRDSQNSQDSQGGDSRLRFSQCATPAHMAEAAGRAVTCRACVNFTTGAPLGHCRRYIVEAFADTPFSCDGYTPSALTVRRLRVEQQLQDAPALRVAADVEGAGLRLPERDELGRRLLAPPEPAGTVSIVLAVRAAAGIVSGEMTAPRERFDTGAFFAYLRQIPEIPS